MENPHSLVKTNVNFVFWVAIAISIAMAMAMETMIKVKMMMVLHQHKDEDDDDDEGINGGGRVGHPSPGLPISGSNLPQASSPGANWSLVMVMVMVMVGHLMIAEIT